MLRVESLGDTTVLGINMAVWMAHRWLDADMFYQQADDPPVTLRTQKFITNRLQRRRQMVVDVLHPLWPNVSKTELSEWLEALYQALLTRHLFPLMSRRHRHLVPGLDLTKTRVRCQHQEAHQSTSTLSTTLWMLKQGTMRYSYMMSARTPVTFKMSGTPSYFYFVLFLHVRPLTGESSLSLLMAIRI